MKVKYAEGPGSLVIADGKIRAKRGEPVEVPNALGKKLIAQGWTEAKATKPSEKPNTERED